MKKVFYYFSKFIIGILFLLIIYILLWSIRINKYGIFSVSKFPKGYLLVGVLILFFFIIIVKDIIKNFDKKKLKIFNYLLLLFLFLIQIVLIFNFNTVQVTDPFYVNDYGISIANGIDKVVDNNWATYFMDYTNNNFVLLFTINLIKFANLFNISNYSKYLIIINALMIDLSILFTYLIARNEKDSKFASFVLLLCVLNPLNYLFMFWTYTPTYSLPFTTLLILLWLKIYKNEKKYFIYAILFGFVTCTGYLMRPTLIIPIIAIIMIFIYDLICKKISLNRKTYTILGIIIFTIFISFIFFNGRINKYVHDQENSFPISHWIMVGLKGDGTIKEKYNDFTRSFKTKQEKKDAISKEIFNTLKGYGFVGLIKHTAKKIPITWDDGTSNYMIRMREDRSPNTFYKYIVNGKNDFIKLYCQVFRIVTLLFISIYLFKCFFDKKYYFVDIYSLILFGAILFYTIWEAKYAYSIPFLPIMIIMQAKAMFNYNFEKKNYIVKLFPIIITLSIILFIFDYKSFTSNLYSYDDYSVFVSNTSGREGINTIVKNNTTIKQEFYSNKSYNNISFLAKVIDENDSKYNISIVDNDNIIYSKIVTYKDIDKSLINIELSDNINNNERKKYEVVINKEDGIDDSIEWYFIKSKTMDSYDGNLYIDNKKYSNDLFMRVYLLNNNHYMGSVTYIIIYLLVISLELILFFRIKKRLK